MKDTTAALKSGDLALEFSVRDGQLALTSLTTGRAAWVEAPAEGQALWQLALGGPGTQTAEVPCTGLKVSRIEERPERVTIEWAEDASRGLKGVTMTVRAEPKAT